MTRKLAILAPAFCMLLPFGMANADAHDECNSMLATAVGMQLEEEGFDMANACNLTVAQLAEIKNLVETEGMGSRDRIEQILMESQ